MRPAHASMLFELERQMDIEIWESIPKLQMQRKQCTGSFIQAVAGTMDLWRECFHFIRLQNTTIAYLKGV